MDILHEAAVQFLRGGVHDRKILHGQLAHDSDARHVDDYGQKHNETHAPIHAEDDCDHAYRNDEVAEYFRVVVSVEHLELFHIVEDSAFQLSCRVFVEEALRDAGEFPQDIALLRSEERRVGKECRSRWSPYH